jgi:hypothetical protein
MAQATGLPGMGIGDMQAPIELEVFNGWMCGGLLLVDPVFFSSALWGG